MSYGVGNRILYFSPVFLSGRVISTFSKYSFMTLSSKNIPKTILNTTFDLTSKPAHHLVSLNTQN